MQLDDLRLDKPILDDVPAIFDIYSDPRVWTHLPSGRHTELEQTESMVQGWIGRWERDGLSSWIVRDAGSGAVLGNVGCWINHDAYWNLGYRLDYGAQGRGIASRVSALAVKEARGLRPDLPVVAILLEHNKASARVAEKVGLTVQHRGPDAGNPDQDSVRLIAADRPLSESQIQAALG
ncbi:GNAT family N-acetyltransferase [Nesterenkonia alkaliphila]|uniref:GNAT family N-acetyltransferase n=1 Tax=Nesterenkonia alkaliphila TaxID=1463631 RepID=A0A7K1UIL6_9MICC|nr:GNAT family N-acetyltransferase [Nesterenkonia alkaliphila]MVT26244.1 GNAT family N-acetyltransferase [Nesterenkonia alkaliphila]GFZ99464.1 hypothetical protein GCM10011359_30550 [Nesterenkonia alkaliphila]